MQNVFSLEELAEELLSQSGLGRVAPMVLPFIRPLIGAGVDKITGTNGDIRVSDFINGRNRSAAKMLQAKYNGREFSNMYGELVSGIEASESLRAAESVFRGFGYSADKAKVAAGSNLGRFIGMGAEYAYGTSAGSNEIARALYSRRNRMTVTPGGAAESRVSQAHSGQQIIEGLLDSYRNREFGRLSFADVSGLTTRMIRTGAFDAASESSDSGGSPGEDSRLARIKARIKNFSGSIDKLKDVIEGDMSKILDSMDKLFGGTTISMATAKLEKVTTSMQHAAMITGASAQTIAQNSALGYSQLAAVGGTQGMGVRIGTEATYFTQTESSDARVSKEELREGAVKALSTSHKTGQSRALAVAYIAWKRMRDNAGNTDNSFKTFMGTMKDEPLTVENITSKTYEYLGNVYKGASKSALTGAMASIQMSDEVIDVQETENISSAITERKVDNLISNRRKVLTAFFNANRKGLSKKYKDADSFIKDVSGGDIYSTTADMKERIYSLVNKNESGAFSEREFTRAVSGLEYQESAVLGVKNARVAQQVMMKSREASQSRSQELVYDKLDKSTKEVLRRARMGGGTFENILNAMYGTKDGLSAEGTTVAKMLSAAFGVDLAEIDKLKDADKKTKIDEALRIINPAGPDRGSALSGIRKRDGNKPETAKEAAEKDADYAIKRTAAEKAIKLIAEGKDSKESRKAIAEWANATNLRDEDKIFYENLNQSQAVEIQTAKGKESALSDNKRRYTLAQSMLTDAGMKQHGQAFMASVSSVQSKLREARKISSGTTDQILNMSEEDRGKLKGSAERRIADLVSAAEDEKDKLKAMGIGQDRVNELFSELKNESNGGVNGFLSSIVELLSKILAKQ